MKLKIKAVVYAFLPACLVFSSAWAEPKTKTPPHLTKSPKKTAGVAMVTGTSFVIDFGQTKLTFVKVDKAWLIVHRSRKKPGKFKAKTIERLCDRRVSKKAYLSDEGLFVSVGEPGVPYVDSKNGRIMLPWNITVTYEDTGRFSTGKALLYLNKKGKLKCAHDDNR